MVSWVRRLSRPKGEEARRGDQRECQEERRSRMRTWTVPAILIVAVGCLVWWHSERTPQFRPSQESIEARAKIIADHKLSGVRFQAFREGLESATPDTVWKTATRYVKRHDTAWLTDTAIRDTGTEVVRWLTLSDSSQRVRGDSLEGVVALRELALADSSIALQACRDQVGRPAWTALGTAFASGLAVGLGACVIGR